MSKKIIMWVCIVLPLAFIGLMTMQVRWIMEAVKLQNRQFEQTVQKCEDYVVARLETDELIEQHTDRSACQRNILDFNKLRQNITNKEQTHEEININFSVDNYGFYKLDTKRNGNVQTTDAGVLDFRVGVAGNDEITNSMVMLNDVLSKRLKYLEARRAKSAFESSPIEARINPQRLDALLMQQLTDNGIDAQYEFAVFNSAGVLAFSSPEYDVNTEEKTYEKKLFPNDIHARAHYMRIYFPTTPNHFKGMMTLIFPTVVFFLLVMTLSGYTVWLVFHQKKLDDIKNDFISNMTHEFKTPISTISLAAQMLKDMASTVSPSFITRNTGIIVDEAKRLTIQVEKILQMSCFDRGTARLKFVEMDVNEIIEKVINNFRVKVESENGEISGQLEAVDSLAMVDEVHFTNVIYNLLDNAFKYRRDAPMIHVWTRNMGDGIAISVRDNGLGISKEDQKRIFDKFYRVSTGDRHDIKGFGLGLAYVKRIVEDHGGRISVESEPNVGTKFTLFLPIKKS